MADIKQEYSSSSTPTFTLASLANGSGRACTAVDNSTNKHIGADIHLQSKLASSSVSATGRLDVYLVRSPDGTRYDDNFGGTDAALTPSASLYLGSIPANTNSQVIDWSISLSELGIELPKKFAICVVNNSGAALDSTGGNHVLTVFTKYKTAV